MLALVLFIFGALTDFWDGWIARRHSLESPLGRILDPTADKIFVLSAMAAFAAKGIYSYWFLVPIFLRETAVTFCRMVWLKQGQAIGAEKAGKLKLGIQVTSVAFSFFYLLRPNSFFHAANQFLIIFAVLMTLYSGFFFFYHNRNLDNQVPFYRTVPTLGVGYLRPAPGTYGTLLGILVIPLIAYDVYLHLLIIVIFLVLAYAVIPRIGLAPHEDPLEIVIDEFCGVLIAFLTVPVHASSLLIGFLLFRIFDVLKPFPLRWLESHKGANGIMLDDVGAGIYTWMILQILFRS